MREQLHTETRLRRWFHWSVSLLSCVNMFYKISINRLTIYIDDCLASKYGVVQCIVGSSFTEEFHCQQVPGRWQQRLELTEKVS